MNLTGTILGYDPGGNSKHDAVVSVLAAVEGVIGNWVNDLHLLSCKKSEKLIAPCGKTNYWWPE